LLESKTAGSFSAAVAADVHVVMPRRCVAWFARRGQRYSGGAGGFFQPAGYDPDSLSLEGITPPVVNVQAFYRQLPNRPDIVAHIEEAFAASVDPTNSAYLADMAALLTGKPGWCARIPEDLQLVRQRAGFRDWCLFTLATNTRNAGLCRLIPIRAGERDPRLSLQAKCAFQASSPYPSGRYGPETPDGDDQMRAVIAMLHYELPHAKDLPPGAIYAAYDRFLHELDRGTDPRHTAARQRFIARVRALRHDGS
jgi:hypothetical protein